MLTPRGIFFSLYWGRVINEVVGGCKVNQHHVIVYFNLLIYIYDRIKLIQVVYTSLDETEENGRRGYRRGPANDPPRHSDAIARPGEPATNTETRKLFPLILQERTEPQIS